MGFFPPPIYYAGVSSPESDPSDRPDGRVSEPSSPPFFQPPAAEGAGPQHAPGWGPPPPQGWDAPSGVPGNGPPGAPQLGASRAARLLLLGVVLAFLTVVWLFLPWVTIGDGQRSLSTNGLRSFPTACFVACTPRETSPWGVLLTADSLLAGVGCVVALYYRERSIANASAAIALLMPLLALIDLLYLYNKTSVLVADLTEVSVTPAAGAFFALVTAVAAAIVTSTAARAVRAIATPRRIAGRPLG